MEVGFIATIIFCCFQKISNIDLAYMLINLEELSLSAHERCT